MKKVAIGITFFALLAGFMLASAWATDPIKIGVLLPLTGSNAPLGQIQKKSALMATGEINAGGGVNGKKIELIIADTKGNSTAGRAAIRKLIARDKVLVISGGFSSTVTWAAISIAQKNKIPFLVNSASADKITEQNWQYIFRLNQPVSVRLEALASFLSTVATDIKSVAIVHANSLKSSAAARRFFKKAVALGLEPVIRERFETGGDDLSPLLTRVQVKDPDLIYAVTDDVKDAARLMRQSKALKLNPKLFVGAGDEFGRPEFAKNAASASEHVMCTVLWTEALPYRGAAAFHQKFVAQNHTPPGHYGAEAYAGITVIADALKRTKVLAPANVRESLTKTNLMTVLGPVKFVSYNNKSRQNKLQAFLVQWLNGQAEVVWPKNMATKNYVYPAPVLNQR